MKNYIKIFLTFVIVGGAIYLSIETINSLKAPIEDGIVFYQNNNVNTVPESSYMWSNSHKGTSNLSQSHSSNGYGDLEVPMSNAYQNPYAQTSSHSDSRIKSSGTSWNAGSMYERKETAYNYGGGSGSMGFASSSNGGGGTGSDGSSMSLSAISLPFGAKQLATQEVFATEEKVTIDPGMNRGEMIPVGDGLLLLIILSVGCILVRRFI